MEFCTEGLRKPARPEHPAAEKSVSPRQTEPRCAPAPITYSKCCVSPAASRDTSGIRAASTGSGPSCPCRQLSLLWLCSGSLLTPDRSNFPRWLWSYRLHDTQGTVNQTQTYAWGWKAEEEIQKRAQLWESLPSSPFSVVSLKSESRPSRTHRGQSVRPSSASADTSPTGGSGLSCPFFLQTPSLRDKANSQSILPISLPGFYFSPQNYQYVPYYVFYTLILSSLRERMCFCFIHVYQCLAHCRHTVSVERERQRGVGGTTALIHHLPSLQHMPPGLSTYLNFVILQNRNRSWFPRNLQRPC